MSLHFLRKDKELDARFDKIEGEIYSINGRLLNTEGQITRPRIVFRDHDEPKEN